MDGYLGGDNFLCFGYLALGASSGGLDVGGTY